MGAMIGADSVNEIAQRVAVNVLPQRSVERVSSEEITDSEGRAALRISITLVPDAVEQVTGNQVLDTLVAMHAALAQAGEERRPVIDFSTTEEIDDDDADPEP